jgi:peptidoglycan/xylan/chitin deacetylase (PgdA/CDA1 family)
MLERVRPRDIIHLTIHHHTVRHSISVLGVVTAMLIIIGTTGALLSFGEDIVSSPAHHTAQVTQPDPPKKDDTPPAKPVDTPPPTPAHDYVIPPVENGIPPIVTNFQTTDPVVFLTIDDGAFKDPSVVQMMKDNHIKASLFLAQTFIQSNPDFFKQITDQGSLIEDHTLTHDSNMRIDMSYQQQKDEICGMADYEQQTYGRRPIFFRPPGGAYTDTMIKAAGACGMRAVVTWIAKANGGSMQYQIGDHLRPGDVVLMHFRPEFKQDMQAFLDAQNAAGLHTELLEDWVN